MKYWYGKTAYLIGPTGGAYYEKTLEVLLVWRVGLMGFS